MSRSYKVLKDLGRGTQGRVALAEGVKGVRFAVKRLPPDFTAIQRDFLKSEIELLARLSHPNLVRFHEFIDDAEGPGYSMEAVDGVSLTETLEASADKAIDLLVQACRGLHHLHARGFVHGDLKPEHLLVTKEGALKIIDFGLSRAAGVSLKAGTPAYLPPEAFWGDYDARADLFSLGAVFYEALAGALPYKHPLTRVDSKTVAPPLEKSVKKAPKALAAVVDWLIKTDPNDRPRSALSVIRYLNAHVEKPFPLSDEESLGVVLQKIPWVSRREEVEFFRVSSGCLIVEGPTGVGRTRFLDEMKMKLQLAGDDRYVFQKDLEEKDPSFLEELHLGLRSFVRTHPASIVVLERNTDLRSAMAEKIFDDTSLGVLTVVRLKDLDEEGSRVFLEGATADLPRPLSKAAVSSLVRSSGGRPLLLLEGLKGALGGAPTSAKSLEQAVAALVASLSEPARKLVALLAVHPFPASELESLAGSSFAEAALELQSNDVAALGPEGFSFRHESLRAAYAKAVSAETLRNAHAAWLTFLTAKTGTTPVDRPESVAITSHALGSGDVDAAQAWKQKAFDVLLREGRLEEGLNLCDRLLENARNAEDRYVIQVYRAAILYRLGRFDDARAAYEAWLQDRPDDGTGLIPLRFYLQVGQVFLGAGDFRRARRSLEKAVALGKPGAAAHRPFLARALLLSATIEEREGRWREASVHLAAARPLAQDDSLLLSELELHEATVAFEEMRPQDALAHAQTCAVHAHASGNSQVQAQSEALGLSLEAMIHRDLGDAESALKILKKAFASAETGGERLQKARLKENLALLLTDLGDYGAAARGFEEAGDALELFGSEDDKVALGLHRLVLESVLGHGMRFERERKKLVAAGVSERSRAEAALALAEHEYRSEHFASADRGFSLAERFFEISGGRRGRLSAKLGRFRCRLRSGEAAESGLELPDFGTWKAWKALIALAASPEWDAAAVKSFLKDVKAVPFPEVVIDLLESLAALARTRDLKEVWEFSQKAAIRETELLRGGLPEEMTMDFDKRKGFEGLEETWDELGSSKKAEAPGNRERTGEDRSIPENRFRQFCEISRQIATRNNIKEVLERVMDAAIELTGAERGFLLLANGKGSAGPIPGYDIPVARHLNQRSLDKGEFQLSLSVVREAIEKGAYVLTDDAKSDPRFQQKASVTHFQLRSILAVPLEVEGEILGAIYMDHRLRARCFQEQDVALINAFASQAALAIQKCRAMEQLEESKNKLEVRVKDLTDQISDITKGMSQKRSDLKFGYDDIIGRSPAMMKVFHLLDRVTDANIPVWIWGESGTGKEMVARSLHDNSPRKKQAFVAENVSAISETLLESELFGHKKGSFTHADRDRVGLFEQASGGTLFLDEVADMSLAMQAKLLRVLQEGEIRPVGSNKKVKVDVRLVTASNRDLRQMVKEGKFRQDLLFRINGMTIPLPPLRQRRDDIPILAKHFIDRISRELGSPASPVTPEALQTLLKHDWPGNVRELEAVLRNAVVFSRGEPITPDLLMLTPADTTISTSAVTLPGSIQTYKRGPADAGEREVLLNALKKHHMDKVEAAKELGVCLKTFYNKLEKHEIPKKRSALLGLLGLKG